MLTPKRHHSRIVAVVALFGLLLAGCGGSDKSPTGPGQPAGPAVLVLGDGGTETYVMRALRAAGYDVRDGGLFYEFTGASMPPVQAVVLLAGVDYNHDMDDRGEQALVDFVARGGGLLTTEWLCFSISRSDYHQVLQTILPVSYANSYASGAETYTVQLDHQVTEGLPATFSTETDEQFSVLAPKTGATVLLRGSRSGAAVVTWTKVGRVVSMNSAGEYGGTDVWNDSINRLLLNAVAFASHK